MISIPISDATFWTQVTELDGTNYLLRFRYNTREASYYMDLAEEDGTDISVGCKVIVDVPLFSNCVKSTKPPGKLIVLTSNGDTTNPALGELGIGLRCELWYYTASDLANIAAVA